MTDGENGATEWLNAKSFYFVLIFELAERARLGS